MEPIMDPSRFYAGPILERQPVEIKLDLPFADNIPDVSTPPHLLSPREEIAKSPLVPEETKISSDLIRIIMQQIAKPATRLGKYTCCYRCGYTSHYANDCFAIRNVYGKYIPTRARARVRIY